MAALIFSEMYLDTYKVEAMINENRILRANITGADSTKFKNDLAKNNAGILKWEKAVEEN